MAIVIQDEKKGINWLSIASVLFVVVVILLTAWYVFFVNPEKAQEVISPKLQTLSDINDLKVDPNRVLQDNNFRNLNPSTPLNLPSQDQVGKSNPFQ